MPSSPKLFHARPYYWNSRRSTVLVLFSLAGFSCLVFGFVAILRAGLRSGCRYGKPLSESVAWDKSSGVGTSEGGGVLGEGQMRHKSMGFVGIQTGFGSAGRRRALRQTWFPADHEGFQRLEESTGLVFRFVIGRTSDGSKMAALKKEITKYDDFLLLDIEDEYTNLPYKTIAFFKAAYALYESDFYVKADDDIYLRPDRLSLLLANDRSHSQTYIGCMKKGPVITDSKSQWHEPLSYLLGKEYFLHAYGPIYALSADVVAILVALRNDRLVVEVSTSKTGKHGHAKCHFVAIDIFNGKKLEDIVPSSHNCDVPHVNRTDYQLIDISEDGFVSLLTENGNTKDDLRLPTDENLLSQIKSGFEEGKDLVVSVMCAMGEEQICALKDIGPKN
ncbi:eukaryotic translation initiation factor 5A [Striga asiatica]|uniref:Eukaryotic translation initiation factor 5A n=1 Tax=Striga asiatica TaxID=4170 RepID=A0A5A7P8S1_STRAF|nr:eukaryotic translation initiation factor 5A [Striga asiatica]